MEERFYNPIMNCLNDFYLTEAEELVDEIAVAIAEGYELTEAEYDALADLEDEIDCEYEDD